MPRICENLTLHRPILFLKWSAQIGEKAFLDVKASEQSWKRSQLCLVYHSETILIVKQSVLRDCLTFH